MLNKNLCCPDCLKHLISKNKKAAELWLYLCEKEVNGIVLSQIEINTFCLLEENRFIITHEVPEWIVIKLVGKTENEKGKHFCSGSCKAEKMQ